MSPVIRATLPDELPGLHPLADLHVDPLHVAEDDFIPVVELDPQFPGAGSVAVPLVGVVAGAACDDNGPANRGVQALARDHAIVETRMALHAEGRSEEHTSELQSRENLVCRLLLEK